MRSSRPRRRRPRPRSWPIRFGGRSSTAINRCSTGRPNRAEAEAALAEITDPRAVPAILHAFGKGRVSDQLRAVQLLGQVDSPSASRSLAGLAVLSKSSEVRRAAVETLKTRDPRDFVRLWIALIRKPIKYEVKPVGGPGSPGTLIVEGERCEPPAVLRPAADADRPAPCRATSSRYDSNGLPVLPQPLGRRRTWGGSRRATCATSRRRTERPGPGPSSTISQSLARSGVVGDPQRLASELGRLPDEATNIINPAICPRHGNVRRAAESQGTRYSDRGDGSSSQAPPCRPATTGRRRRHAGSDERGVVSPTSRSSRP